MRSIQQKTPLVKEGFFAIGETYLFDVTYLYL